MVSYHWPTIQSSECGCETGAGEERLRRLRQDKVVAVKDFTLTPSETDGAWMKELPTATISPIFQWNICVCLKATQLISSKKRIDMYCRFIFFYASFFSLSCKTLVSTSMSINPWNQSLVLCLNEKMSVLILEQIWFLSLLHCMRWIMVSLILSVTSKSYVAGFVSHVSPINQQLLYGICHENNNYKKKNETH